MAGKYADANLAPKYLEHTRVSPPLTDFVRDIWLPAIRVRKTSWLVDDRIAKNHILPVLGGKRLDEIEKEHVQRWLEAFDEQDCALTTRNRRLNVLKNIFNLAVEKGYLSEAPTRNVPCAQVKKAEGYSLSHDKIMALLKRLEQSDRKEAKAIALLLLTGARKGEIITARWENLFLEEHVLLVPGVPRGRKIWLSAKARHIVCSIPRHKESPWIFPGRDATRPMSDIFLFWKELRAEFGLNSLRIRDLRHVFADWQLRSGMSPVAVQRCLGIADMRHASPQTLFLSNSTS